jgi:hypothetical protein
MENLDQLASDSGNNKAVLEDLATAYVRIGRIQGAQLTAHLGANEHLCADLAHTGNFSEALLHCRTSLSILQAAATADPHDVQAAEDLATVFNTMSDALDRMGKPQDAMGWESKARTLYRSLEVRNPGSLETATNDATSLLHFGSLEAARGCRKGSGRRRGICSSARSTRARKITRFRTLYQQATHLAASAKPPPDWAREQ